MSDEQGAIVERMLFDALEAIVRGDTGPWSEMFQEQGVMEFPYAPPGFPKLLEGKSTIGAYMRSYPDHVSMKRFDRKGVHHADGVMVVEFSGEGHVMPSGNPIKMQYVGVISHSGGKIDHYRDYWDALAAVSAMGGLESLQSMGAGVSA